MNAYADRQSKKELLEIKGCVISARIKTDLTHFINRLLRSDSIIFSPYMRAFFEFSLGEESETNKTTKESEELNETRKVTDKVNKIDEE